MNKSITTEATRNVLTNDYATKQDVSGLGHTLRSEITEMKVELRAEMVEMKVELRAEMTEMKSELRCEMFEMKNELREEIAQTKRDLGAMIEDQNHKIQFIAETMVMMNEKMDRRHEEFLEYRKHQDAINNATWFRVGKLEGKVFEDGADIVHT
jgi:predicted nuclease with TOPRIM domain